MATEGYDFTGKTVEEAIADGLRTLGLTEDQVTVDVLSKGSRGIFGLGSEPAHVRLIPRSLPGVAPVDVAVEPVTPTQEIESITPAPQPEPTPQLDDPEVEALHAVSLEKDDVMEDGVVAADEEGDQSEEETEEEVAAIATETLTQTVVLIGLKANIQATWRTGGDEFHEHNERYLLLDVQGGDLGALIGRRGETLESLQFLLRLMVNQRLRRWQNIVVDVEGYKERRVHQLKQLAQRTASQVATTGRTVALEPMPANERRIVHIALRDHPNVYTESSGEGERRKVQIIAKS
jgi:spoIIIJ-associated protein